MASSATTEFDPNLPLFHKDGHDYWVINEISPHPKKDKVKVLWSNGESTPEPIRLVKHTSVYKEYKKQRRRRHRKSPKRLVSSVRPVAQPTLPVALPSPFDFEDSIRSLLHSIATSPEISYTYLSNNLTVLLKNKRRCTVEYPDMIDETLLAELDSAIRDCTTCIVKIVTKQIKRVFPFPCNTIENIKELFNKINGLHRDCSFAMARFQTAKIPMDERFKKAKKRYDVRMYKTISFISALLESYRKKQDQDTIIIRHFRTKLESIDVDTMTPLAVNCAVDDLQSLLDSLSESNPDKARLQEHLTHLTVEAKHSLLNDLVSSLTDMGHPPTLVSESQRIAVDSDTD